MHENKKKFFDKIRFILFIMIDIDQDQNKTYFFTFECRK